jgi:hypothetical protein
VIGRSWVAQHHGVERTADAVADVYREIVSR